MADTYTVFETEQEAWDFSAEMLKQAAPDRPTDDSVVTKYMYEVTPLEDGTWAVIIPEEDNIENGVLGAKALSRSDQLRLVLRTDDIAK